MREKTPPPNTTGDVPAWFMTYSDVITLLMTFFILLLTFATNEPESFERMRTTVFGGKGSTGIAGESPKGPEQDSWVVRVRPRSARMTMEGSETPPINMETPQNALDDGLRGLEQDEEREITDSIKFKIPASYLGTADGELFDYGAAQLNLISRVLSFGTFEAAFRFSDPRNLDRAISCVLYLRENRKVDQGRLAIQQVSAKELNSEFIEVQLRNYQSKTHGPTASSSQ